MTMRRRALRGLGGGQQRVVEMGTVVEFPVGAAACREGESAYRVPREGSATVVILPVVRIERYAEETRGDTGPTEGTTRRRRKRRARS
jgi:hypothetical protein